MVAVPVAVVVVVHRSMGGEAVEDYMLRGARCEGAGDAWQGMQAAGVLPGEVMRRTLRIEASGEAVHADTAMRSGTTGCSKGFCGV